MRETALYVMIALFGAASVLVIGAVFTRSADLGISAGVFAVLGLGAGVAAWRMK